jgi:hypothetical protein
MGLMLQKKSGSIQFGRIKVHYDILPPVTVKDRKTKEEIEIKKPIALKYEIDGRPFPDEFEKFYNEAFKILEKEFNEKIEPYFESLGYYLWSY